MKNLIIFKNGVRHLTPLAQVVLTVYFSGFLTVLVFVNSQPRGEKKYILGEGSMGKFRRKGEKLSEFLKLDDTVEYHIHIIVA